MDTSKILNELRAESDRIHKAIAALEALDATAAVIHTVNQPQATSTVGSGKRKMSAAARRKISEAAKRRWAAQKAQTAKPQTSAKQAAPKPAAPKRGMSPAGRKRISEMMKKRWAARKKAAA